MTTHAGKGLMIDANALKRSVQGKKVLTDSNIIIYLTEETAPYHHLSLELFSMIEQGSASAVISILSVAEVMSGPLRAGKADVAMTVKNYLLNFPNIHCQQTTAEVLDMVGRDERVNWQILRPLDALIIASGLHAQVDFFISNDRHFISSLPSEIMLSYISS